MVALIAGGMRSRDGGSSVFRSMSWIARRDPSWMNCAVVVESWNAKKFNMVCSGARTRLLQYWHMLR